MSEQAIAEDPRQTELGLEGGTVSPREIWEAYKRSNPEWRDAWWRRTLREEFKELRSSFPRDASEREAGAVWTTSLGAPWNAERNTHEEPAGIDEPMSRGAALEIAREMFLVEVLNSAAAAGNLESTRIFDWEPEPGRLYSCFISGMIERDGLPQNGIQEFDRVVGAVFITDLVKSNPGDLSDKMLVDLAGGEPRRLEGDTSTLTLEEVEQFWVGVDVFLQPDGEVHEIERAPEPSTAIQPVPRKANARQTRLLLDGVTRMDKRTDALIGLLDGRGLPRSWEKVRLWTDMVEEEKQRLQTELGDTAFNPGGPLVKKINRQGEFVDLSPAAKKALRDKAGLTGFRELVKDPDRVEREYLTKYIRRPGGYVEARVTWYGVAWPMSPTACEKVRQQTEAAQASLDQDPTLFEDLNERRRQQAESRLGWLQCLSDARRIADVLIRRFGHEGVNPISIPDRELRAVLSDDDPHGHERVKGAMFALGHFRYQLKVTGKDPLEAFGSLIYDSEFTPGGAGDHKDGLWRVALGQTAIGVLGIFERAQPKTVDVLRDTNRRLFDFSAPVKDAKMNYQRRDSIITPYFMRMAKLTTPQERLLRWMEWNITRNQDNAAIGRRYLRVKAAATNATEPRTYTDAFCPLLPAGEYVAALGHFNASAECGFRLKALMATMEVSDKGDAVQALLAVTEKTFPGCAAVRYQNRWLKGEESLGQSNAATAGNWFLFLPKGWVDLMHQSISNSSDYEVTRDTKRYRSANIAPYDPGTVITSPNDPVFTLPSRMGKGRFDKKMSQAELARILGVSQQRIALWESKKKPIPAGQVPKIEAWLSTIYPSTKM